MSARADGTDFTDCNNELACGLNSRFPTTNSKAFLFVVVTSLNVILGSSYIDAAASFAVFPSSNNQVKEFYNLISDISPVRSSGSRSFTIIGSFSKHLPPGKERVAV
jgi:hypothetical protein